MKIQFNPNYQKILEGIIWIANMCPGKDFHFILKTMFYADKWHLQRFGRPVFGDIYIKMSFGPVASAAYDFLKLNEYMPAPFLEQAAKALQVDRSSKVPSVTATRKANETLFSGTDTDCLSEALDKCRPMSFDQLCEATHEDPAWIEAEMNREMSWEKIIDEDVPDREALIEYIYETSSCVAV